jgi:tetratricopeptide (TPR) repeat protein
VKSSKGRNGGASGRGEQGRPSPDVDRALAEAHRLGEEEDWEEMARVLREALEDHPGEPYLLCWLGVAERELGLQGIAYERFKACLAQHPEDPQLLATAGNAVAAFDDPDAEAALRTAALLAPELAFTRWMYGAYLAREGFLAEGLRELQAARELDPDEAGISFELGVALALSGNYEGAVDELYRAAELDPEDGWIRVVLGLALLEEERGSEALIELELGARARPDDAEAQLLASLAARETDEDLAWEMLERARLSAFGVDLVLVQEVEERLEEGGESARAFLSAELAPAAYRERLRQRP